VCLQKQKIPENSLKFLKIPKDPKYCKNIAKIIGFFDPGHTGGVVLIKTVFVYKSRKFQKIP
jgi:hypothetical protein